MAKKAQHVVICYDIHDPRRLARVAKISKDFGERVLKSVFECNLTPNQLDRMKSRIDDVIDHMEDSVRFYLVCEKCRACVDVFGFGPSVFQEEELVIR